ncbi:MAG: FRG domain-containing protein [Phycisphaerae bacterium]|nr:FRG domain-containing protein [Phycisphaerae bacterium]
MSKCSTYKIEHINHLVEVGAKLYPFWFRGHSKCFGNLLPRIFRQPERIKGQFKGGSREHEFSYIEEYQRKVPVFASNIPERRDIGWLLMMQHYGAPTRLLDWTENVLVAAYFAVHENKNEDGEIWVMFPQRLNKHYAGEYFWLWDSPQVSYLAKEPFCTNPRELAKDLDLRKIPQTPLAFYPCLNNPRMVAQSAVFTIHPKPNEDKSNTIRSLLKNTERGVEIVRYIIPSEFKANIFRDLNKLGINRTRLFPEQESVAVDMLDHWTPGLGYPKKAAECGGKVETT